MQKTTKRTIIFTGGHHSSALAVAQNLIQKNWHVIWIGHKYSMWKDQSPSAEYLEVTRENIPFFELTAGKIYRTLNPLKLLRVPLGLFQSLSILFRLKLIYKKQLVGIVSFGGYLGPPVVIAGWLLGILSICHEQTSTSGWANRLSAVFSRKVAVTWPSSIKLFPPHKVVLTGLPLRPEISRIKMLKKVTNQIYITGGKQGSHIINEVVFSLLPTLLESYTVVHQTGSSSVFNDYDKASRIRESLPVSLRSKYQIFRYLLPNQTADVLANSQVVVSRSGAHITYELAFLRTNCVLIPIPWASHNEQYKNALVLERAHQAVILPQEVLTPESLLSSIKIAQNLTSQKLSVIENGLNLVVQLVEQTFK